jgi:hypothetical protein
MRLFLFFLLFSSVASAQVNRSAKELAKEHVVDYIEQKLFKKKPYKSLGFSELKPLQEIKATSNGWYLKHEFVIGLAEKDNKKDAVTCAFIFYFDEKMHITSAQQVR